MSQKGYQVISTGNMSFGDSSLTGIIFMLFLLYDCLKAGFISPVTDFGMGETTLLLFGTKEGAAYDVCKRKQ